MNFGFPNINPKRKKRGEQIYMTTYLIRWTLLMIVIGIGIGVIATICVAVILAKRQEKKRC